MLITVNEFVKAEPAVGGVQYVYAMIRRGVIPGVRIGRKVLINLDQWEQFKRDGGKALPGGWRREASV